MRAIVLAIWLASVLPACGGSMPDLRKADVGALVDSLDGELTAVSVRLDMAATGVETVCVLRPLSRCPDARGAVAKARAAVTRARDAITEARAHNERFHFAADRVTEAVDAVAKAVAAVP